MQRALKAAESVEPQLMKPQVSPNKVPTPAATQKDASANQKKDIIPTQKADVAAKDQKDSPTRAAQKKEETDITKTSTTASPLAKETPGTVSTPAKEEKTASPPTKEVPIPTAPPIKEKTVVVSDVNKPLPAQTPVNKVIETSLQNKKDVTPPSSPAPKGVSEKKEEKAEIVQKSADQPSSDEVEPPKALKKESNSVETSLAKSAPAEQPTNQESGGFFSFGSPKSQRAASKTTEAVTGKMLGFGSSLFSSASTLITSAVKEESRTTPPSSRKMSAPAQVSGKMSPKSSPPVSPRMTSVKEAKPSAAQKPHPEKIPDQPQQAKAPPSEQAKVDKSLPELAKPEASEAAPKGDQSTCPLCKAGLNIGSKDLPNYNTCTECKAAVCNKCGFSPMPSVKEVIK